MTASVDIIEASGKAYFIIWRERAYLWKLAMVPILIKLVCDITVFSLGWQTEFIKQTLIMLPGHLAEGWMLAHFIRLIFLGHRWPFQPSGDVDKDLHELKIRARGIMGSMIIYVLIKMALMAFIAFSYQAGGLEAEDSAAKSAEDSTLLLFIFSVMGLAVFVWLFRYLWIYIPVALNYPLRGFLRQLGGFSSSFSLMGVWLICFLPIFFLFGVLVSSIVAAFEAGAPAFAGFTLSIMRVFTDTVLSLIVTGGICYALADMLGGAKRVDRKK